MRTTPLHDHLIGAEYVTCQGYYVHSTGNHVPHSPNGIGDIPSLWNLGTYVLKQVHLSDIMRFYVLDVQLWMEFCGDYISDNGSLYLVYRTNDRLEVRVVRHIPRHNPS